MALFNNFPPVVELGSERVLGGINILSIEVPSDGWQGDVNMYAVYSDVLKWGLFGGAACLSIYDRRVATYVA